MPEIPGDMFEDDFEDAPTSQSEAEEDEDVSECPPPSDDETEELEDCVHAGVNAALAMSHDALLMQCSRGGCSRDILIRSEGRCW